MLSLTSALSALFLLCLCVRPNFYFCSAKEIGGSNTAAPLPAKEPCPLVMPTLGRCAESGMGAAWTAGGDVPPEVGKHLRLNFNLLLAARL